MLIKLTKYLTIAIHNNDDNNNDSNSNNSNTNSYDNSRPVKSPAFRFAALAKYTEHGKLSKTKATVRRKIWETNTSKVI